MLVGVTASTAVAATSSSTHRAAHHRTWRAVFSGSFNGGYSKKIWTRYTGVPRCCAATHWSPSHVAASRGILHIQNYAQNGKWVSGGVSMGRSLNQTYGKWSVRFRMAQGMGVGMCIGLWPKQGWPPEIDFAEESSVYGNRHVETGTFHHGAQNLQNHARVGGDFSRWHVMTVVWTPGRITYLKDGKRWHTITGSTVPHQPMHLIMQTHVGSNGVSGLMPSAASNRHVDLEVDWVHVYRMVR